VLIQKPEPVSPRLQFPYVSGWCRLHVLEPRRQLCLRALIVLKDQPILLGSRTINCAPLDRPRFCVHVIPPLLLRRLILDPKKHVETVLETTNHLAKL
jgi:hypothetical protein